MVRLCFVGLPALLILLIATSVSASNSDDFFHGASPPQPYLTPQVAGPLPAARSDLFALPPQQTSTDLFGSNPHTDDPTGQDMLSVNVHRMPDDPLYKAPKDRIYP